MMSLMACYGMAYVPRAADPPAAACLSNEECPADSECNPQLGCVPKGSAPAVEGQAPLTVAVPPAGEPAPPPPAVAAPTSTAAPK